jgi:transcriptional regulator with XRE-family HTH domain
MKAIQRIYKAMQDKGLKASQVEKELGLSNGYLSVMLKRNGNLGEDVLVKCAHYFELSLNFLLTGEDETAPNLIHEPPVHYIPIHKPDQEQRIKDLEAALAAMQETIKAQASALKDKEEIIRLLKDAKSHQSIPSK